MGSIFGKLFLKKNPTIVIFLIAFAVGFGVCYFCCRLYQKIRVLEHKILPRYSKPVQVQISDTIIYTCCTISAIIWGIVAVNINFDNVDLGFFIACSLITFGIIFLLFSFIEMIITPLPAEVYDTEKNLVAVRLIKVLFTISFYLDVFLLCYLLGKETFLDNLFEYGLAVVVPFFIFWGISYIAFGSGNPFFVFKYKPNQVRKKGDSEYIDTEIVE